jgi:UDP-3-O-[3-hydroxymyristoyl] N-acetylglucosamine deacetylase/3-hydroxyacyl-[acyl-carrier-protein] dehydratase
MLRPQKRTTWLKSISVSTIEHLLAAFSGMIDNALVELNGPEVPILDGSSRIFVEEILKAGHTEQNADRYYYRVREKMEFRDEANGIELVVYPDEAFSVDVHIDYNSRVLGNQFASFTESQSFAKEYAPQDICFLRELETLLT